jgi:protoporphyrinogen oxidase
MIQVKMLIFFLFFTSFFNFAYSNPNLQNEALEFSGPVRVLGRGDLSFLAQPASNQQVQVESSYDIVIIGGGLSGLSAALYLSDQGKKVLLLEKEPQFGGLAASGVMGERYKYGRGAAYWTPAYEEEREIFNHIGLANYEKKYSIHEPIDSYLWGKKLYLGVWEEKTLLELPASFLVFKNELELADKEGMISNQPLEEAKNLKLDEFTAAQWVRKMPEQASLRTDPKSREIYKKYLSDSRVPKNDPMIDVIHFLDLYSRSTYGINTEQLSALAFANFYISELDTRYASTTGNGVAAEKLIQILQARPDRVKMILSATVTQVTNQDQQTETRYFKDNQMHVVKSKFTVFAAQLGIAQNVLPQLKDQSPEIDQAMRQLEYVHYAVHGVAVKGHPYRASFDTWVRGSDYSENDFVDVILGRWVGTDINGFHGMRDFKKNPPDDHGIMTIYHPLSKEMMKGGLDEEASVRIAKFAVNRMLQIFNPILKNRWGTSIQVQSVETNRWPYSIHVVKPGHFKTIAKILRKPFGRIYFANNNIGTPSIEEALFRGHCAANNILHQMDSSFKQESWTRCPIE